MTLPREDFAVISERGTTDPPVLHARGRMTAAGGELLYCAIATLCGQAGELVADLTEVTEVEPAGWAWFLPALQECHAAGCQLRIVPPTVAAGAAESSTPSRSAGPATLRCYPAGPILLRGDFELLDRDGRPLPRERSVVALCRCGGSANKPFCDGTHKLVRFSDG